MQEIELEGRLMYATKEIKQLTKRPNPPHERQTSRAKANGTKEFNNPSPSPHFLQRDLGNSYMRSVAENQSFRTREEASTTPAPSPSPTSGIAPPLPTTPPSPTPPAAPPTATAPPTIMNVEVDNSRSSITYHVPSNRGAAGRQHWVTVASLSGTPTTVRVNLDPPVPPTDPRAAALQWTINGRTVASSGDPLHVEVRRNAGKKVVRATLGGSSAELTIWAVFARIRASGTPSVSTSTSATRFNASAVADFTATILPRSIITDSDHPNLGGSNTVPPPDNGTQICGRPLGGGVDHKWDVSRRIRQHVLNPASLVPIPASDACLWANRASYPANTAEGNDDTHAGDENNNPYTGGGVITSHDPPSDFINHTQGNDGDTMEIRMHFQEFARLEYHRTWWRISYFLPWRFHIRARKDPITHRWVDDNTNAALDNTGF